MDAAPLDGQTQGHGRGQDSRDDADVPAAVLCATCGRTDCTCPLDGGVEHVPAGTPWEQRNAPPIQRLWRTAILATVEGESFFGELGEGSVGAAFRFALLCELFAIARLAILWAPLSYVLVPGLVRSIFFDGERGPVALIGVVAAVPVLAVLMVLLHLLWGTIL